jgi:hypothetical protein
VGVPPFVAGLADVGEKTAERFKTLTERYEKWRVDENVINEFINAPLNRERPYKALLRQADSPNLSPPLVKLKEALEHVQDEVVQDAAVVAALVLYKTLVKNAKAYGEWAGWYVWARGLVEKQEFTMATEEVRRLREAHRRLEKVAEEVRRELNAVLALYALHSRELYEKLRSHLEVDVKMAEGLAEASRKRFSGYSDANMGTKAYAALLSAARGGIYGHAAILLAGEGALADIVLLVPVTAYKKASKVAGWRGEAVDPSYSRRGTKAGKVAGGRGGAVDLLRVEEEWKDTAASALLRFLIGYSKIDPQLLSGAGEVNLKFRRVEKDGKKEDEKKRVVRGFQVFRVYGGVESPVGELWIGKTAYFKISRKELRRFVEEAKRHKPDLSGIKKIWHALPWFNTDASFEEGQIVAATAHLWQLRWYLALFGGVKVVGGVASITEEGFKLYVQMRWRREVLGLIIAEEGEELKPLLGTAQEVSQKRGGDRAVNSWRELVDAID